MVFLTTRFHVFLNLLLFASCKWAKKQRSGVGVRSEVARLFNGEVTLRNVQEGACWLRFDFTVTSHSFKFFPHAFVSCCHCKGEDYVEIPPVLKMTTLFGAVLLLLIPIMLIRR